MPPRFRFAPSPTGLLHVGGARTAVLNWLLARHAGGALVLRLEDTDVERNVRGAEAEILDDLRWLGLDWDEGPDVGGPAGPYRQSERGELYMARAMELLARGAAYVCTCPPAAGAPGEGRPRCACAERVGDPPAAFGVSIRFRAPDAGEVEVEDAIRGSVMYPAESLEDFVLLRSDGRPTYNFAAVVDDAAMGITDVLRGADLLTSTARQILLYRALGLEAPRWIHVPLLLGPDGERLAKRHGAVSLRELRERGEPPERVVGALAASCGLAEAGEALLPRDLVPRFSLDRLPREATPMKAGSCGLVGV